MLTPEDLNTVKDAIIEKIQQLKVDILELEELTKPIAPDNAIGRVSRMDAIVNKSVNEGLLQKSRSRLVLMENALADAGKKDFGICIRCGQSIPLGRILLMPESKKCVRCA